MNNEIDGNAEEMVSKHRQKLREIKGQNSGRTKS
jgi:hypothetical protein